MNHTIDDWRKQIDSLDDELLLVLSKRVDVVREIGTYKKANGIAPLDTRRWPEVLESRLSKADSHHLSRDFIHKLYEVIHEYSLEIEANR